MSGKYLFGDVYDVEYNFNNEEIRRFTLTIYDQQQAVVKAIEKHLFVKYGRDDIIVNNYLQAGKAEWVLNKPNEQPRIVAIIRSTLDCNNWNLQYWCEDLTVSELRELYYKEIDFEY